MNPPATVTVTDPQGVHGTIETTAWPLDGRRAEVLVSLESGQQVLVPVQMLIREEEGRYSVPMALAELERRAGADPSEPPLREEVVIARVPVNRGVEGPIPVRYEKDTMIISLLEEVLVVETRLLLKEEVHMTTRRTGTHTPERVTLRHEDVTIERVDLERNEPHSQGQEESHGEDHDRTL